MKNFIFCAVKPVCLGPSILELCEILMYEFWYKYVKPKYGDIVYIKAEDIEDIGDIEEDVEIRFDTSNYELDRPLPKGKHKK